MCVCVRLCGFTIAHPLLPAGAPASQMASRGDHRPPAPPRTPTPSCGGCRTPSLPLFLLDFFVVVVVMVLFYVVVNGDGGAALLVSLIGGRVFVCVFVCNGPDWQTEKALSSQPRRALVWLGDTPSPLRCVGGSASGGGRRRCRAVRALLFALAVGVEVAFVCLFVFGSVSP